MGCRRLLVSIVVVLVTVAATASADPIVVTGGALVSGDDGTLLRISGAGLSTDGRARSDFSWLRTPIETGVPFSLTHTFDTFFSIATCCTAATATVNGIVYPQVFLHASNFAFVTPSVTAPSQPREPVFLTLPFRFNGTLEGFELIQNSGTGPQRGPQLFSQPLTGQGEASIRLFAFNGGLGSDVYSFAFQPQGPSPTPEPATLLLVGTGLVIAARRRSRSARSSSL